MSGQVLLLPDHFCVACKFDNVSPAADIRTCSCNWLCRHVPTYIHTQSKITDGHCPFLCISPRWQTKISSRTHSISGPCRHDKMADQFRYSILYSADTYLSNLSCVCEYASSMEVAFAPLLTRCTSTEAKLPSKSSSPCIRYTLMHMYIVHVHTKKTTKKKCKVKAGS